MINNPRKAARENNASLTAQQVLRIRALAEQGYAARALGQFYGVGTETIRRILRRDTWDWLKDESSLIARRSELPELSEAERMAAQESEERLRALLANEQTPPSTPATAPELISEEALAKARAFGNKL